MSTPFSIDRRSAMRLLASIGLAGSTRPQEILAGISRSVKDPGFDTVNGFFSNLESASYLGAAYLRIRPEEADFRHLCQALGIPRSSEGPAGKVPGGRLAESITQKHRADFRNARVLKLAGWSLSYTELRLSALVYLGDADAEAESKDS